jgi:mannonate dehydratase
MMNRRRFMQTATSITAGGLAGVSCNQNETLEISSDRDITGTKIKLAWQLPSNFTGDDLQLVKQLGVDYVTVWTSGNNTTLDNFIRIKSQINDAGLKVWNIGNSDVHNMEGVTLNLADRDKKIAEYIQYLRNIGKAGIFYTTYAHMGNGIWSTEREPVRGAAMARAFNLETAKEGQWGGKIFRAPLTHGRKYSQEEIWDNYTYFIKKVVPVAEEEGIRIGIHPDDPPVPELGGVPRCIFSSFEGYKKALEIADSPNIGLCLCCGCWLEGGELMGRDIVETIQYFGKKNKIFKVHLRNVVKPLPHFTETFLNDGFMDMYKIMKALREVNNDCAIIADHMPQTIGGRNLAFAYSIGYIQALLERAESEFVG